MSVATALALLPISLLLGQPSPQFVPVSEISDESLNSLVDHAIVMSFDLSPDGRQVAILAIAGSKVGAPLWVVTFDTRTTRVVASRELGPSVWLISVNFHHQVVYSSDQRYLVVQDLREIKVLDARNLEPVRTIPIPASASRLVPLSVVGASKSDVFVCAFGSERQPQYGLLATPVQIEIVDVSSGKILDTWAAQDVPQAVSPNGDLIAVSWWQTPNERRVVPLAVFDRNGRKVADLDDGFSFSKGADQSKPLGRVLGRFVSEEEIVAIPDEHTDDTGHQSGDNIRLVNVTGRQAQQTVSPGHFAPIGGMAVSGNGKTILVNSFYIPPRLLAQRHGPLHGGEGKLLILERDPKLHVDSSVPIDSNPQEPRVSSDSSVIAIRHYRRDITVLMRKSSTTASAQDPRPGN